MRTGEASVMQISLWSLGISGHSTSYPPLKQLNQSLSNNKYSLQQLIFTIITSIFIFDYLLYIKKCRVWHEAATKTRRGYLF